MHVHDVRVAGLDCRHDVGRRLADDADPCDRRLGVREDDVLRLLDVDARFAQALERVASTPGRSWWRTTRTCVAGVFRLRLTTFGTRPVRAYVWMIRTASSAIACCAWSVEAPM